MRAFIGIDFDREMKAAIGQLQQKLRKYAVKGRWKHVDNFHLTLKFLDEISESQQDQINKAMKDLCAGISPFSLTVSELGIFSGRESIRVLWLGLGGEIEALRRLQKETDARLEGIGFEKEKRSFKPHITIGQDLEFGFDFDTIRKMADINAFPTVYADRMYLYKSEQIGNKRVYTRMGEYVFEKNK